MTQAITETYQLPRIYQFELVVATAPDACPPRVVVSLIPSSEGTEQASDIASWGPVAGLTWHFTHEVSHKEFLEPWELRALCTQIMHFYSKHIKVFERTALKEPPELGLEDHLA